MNDPEIPGDFIKALAYQAAKDSSVELQEGEYRCAMCGEIFTFADDWDDEKAMDEAKQNGFELDDCVIVCDDCYKRTVWI